MQGTADNTAFISPRPRVAVLGAGNMGSALAHALASQGCQVSLWDHFSEVVEDIQTHRENRRFLPGILLQPDIRACRSSAECVAGAALVIVSVPSAFIADTLEPILPVLNKGAVLVNVAKGFAPGTQHPLICSLEQRMPEHRWVHLAGPCVANEFVHGQQAFIVMASSSETTARLTADWFNGTHFKTSITSDLMGAALGGILKNVYAILLGCLNKLNGQRQNLGAAVITACIAEMADIAAAHGAQRSTIYGLSGLGDLVATGCSLDSHNRRFGELLASGKSVSEIKKEAGWLPEGVAAALTTCTLAESNGVSAPLAEWVRRSLVETPPTLGGLLDALRTATSIIQSSRD